MRCTRCPQVWRPTTWHVEPGNDPVCRDCALADPALARWQQHCDVSDAIDALMQVATDRRERLLFADLLTQRADHFARWRWPEEER